MERRASPDRAPRLVMISSGCPASGPWVTLPSLARISAMSWSSQFLTSVMFGAPGLVVAGATMPRNGELCWDQLWGLRSRTRAGCLQQPVVAVELAPAVVHGVRPHEPEPELPTERVGCRIRRARECVDGAPAAVRMRSLEEEREPGAGVALALMDRQHRPACLADGLSLVVRAEDPQHPDRAVTRRRDEREPPRPASDAL